MESVYCAVRTVSLSRLNSMFIDLTVAQVSLRGLGFDPKPLCVRFVADKVALGQVLTMHCSILLLV